MKTIDDTTQEHGQELSTVENEENGGTVQIVSCSSSLSTSECTKIRYYASMFAGYIFPALEIGSYIGTSTVSIGIEYKAKNNIVYSVDHHRGSEEHHPSGNNFENCIFDEKTGKINTFEIFRGQIENFGLEKTIIPIVCDSNTVAKHWNIPLSFLFIDGDHGIEQPVNDVKNFGPYVVEGGLLAMHDVDVYGRIENSYKGPTTAFFEAIRMGFTPVDYKTSLVFLRKGEPELYNMSKNDLKEITDFENN